MPDVFVLPAAIDLSAQAFAAASGALLAVRKGYDVVGITALALATSAGGGVIRDCLLQSGPVTLITNPSYVLVAVISGLGVLALHRVILRYERHLSAAITGFDALSLGLFAVVGLVKAQNANLAWPAVILVGIITAVGGGVLRDVLSREEPLLFRPGQFYALAAFGGGVLFVILHAIGWRDQLSIGLCCAALVLFLRLGSVWFDWRTGR